jgi:peptidyl-prolyl cis-trans isomerase B (cyclophilin B)
MLPAMPRTRHLLTGLAIATTLAAAGCGDSSKKKADTSAAKPATGATTTATTPAKPKQATCEKVSAPAPKSDQKLKKPALKLDPSKTYTATVDTSCGAFTIELAVKDAPKTDASFVSLARRGFYDDLTFHRIVQGFVIQGGDPQGTGNGGPGYSVVEAPPKNLKYKRGVVAMAKTQIEDPGTSGSQFFVVTGPDAQLPADYAYVGNVTGGMDVVQRIAVVPTGPNDMPVDPVVIKSVKVKES